MKKIMLALVLLTSTLAYSQVESVLVTECTVTDLFSEARVVKLYQNREVPDKTNPAGLRGLNVNYALQVDIQGGAKLNSKSNYIYGSSNPNKRKIETAIFSDDLKISGILNTKANDAAKKTFSAEITLLNPELNISIIHLPLECTNVLN